MIIPRLDGELMERYLREIQESELEVKISFDEDTGCWDWTTENEDGEPGRNRGLKTWWAALCQVYQFIYPAGSLGPDSSPTVDPASDPTICKACSHHIQIEGEYFCRAAETQPELYIDVVTGERKFQDGTLPSEQNPGPPLCRTINDGDCPHYTTEDC